MAAVWFPRDDAQDDRPERLMALHALNVWVMAPEDRLSNETILAYVQRNDLRSQMTEDELAVLKMTRTQAAAAKGQSMGWTQENMWSLAWMLGFETEPALGAPLIDDRVVEPMLDFLPTVAEGKLADFLKKAKPRSEGEVKAMEDLFYAAHNAARSAQMGDETVVPKGFRPVVEGGAIHERRHSLTWAMSPGVAWDATDLST